ncbi:MAG: cob(I)yrinic acid a,c-diamide adenosyltransferase [Chloroflexota bacterium]
MAGKGKRTGLILVHTGNGKGKTTAALGIAFRAMGYGMKVLMVQFLKGAWKPGEYRAAQKFEPNFRIRPMGQGFLWIEPEKKAEQNQAMVAEAWEYGRRQVLEGDWDVVIFDEINYAVSYGMIPVDEVTDMLRHKPETLHVVLTGRNAAAEVIDLADTVTEMRPIKHAYEKGTAGQKGIEF